MLNVNNIAHLVYICNSNVNSAVKQKTTIDIYLPYILHTFTPFYVSESVQDVWEVNRCLIDYLAFLAMLVYNTIIMLQQNSFSPGFELVGSTLANPDSDPSLSESHISEVVLDIYHNPAARLGNTLLRFNVTPSDVSAYQARAKDLGLDDQKTPVLGGGQFGVIRWNLEQSILIAPLEPGQPAEQSNNPAAIVAKRLGIRSERGVKGNSEFLNIWCTLGASALGDLNDIVPGLGDSVSLRDYEANDGGMSYPGSMLTEGMSNGTVLVAPTPQEGVSLETTAWSAVHDNILHLYGNLLLRTPEFNELVRQFGPEKDVGKLDSSLAYAAGHIHGLRDYSWYNKLIGKEHFAPYAGLRGFLGTFLDSGNSSVKRLNREIELLNKFRTGKASELEEDEYRTLVLGKDSVLDQFDQAANSIPQRFLAVTADLYKEPALDNSKIVAITQALASQLLKV